MRTQLPFFQRTLGKVRHKGQSPFVTCQLGLAILHYVYLCNEGLSGSLVLYTFRSIILQITAPSPSSTQCILNSLALTDLYHPSHSQAATADVKRVNILLKSPFGMVRAKEVMDKS